MKIAQIEKDKSEELTQLKLRYFTNITHDFMTPLTIVSCLIDEVETLYEKESLSQFGVMRSNINRLRRLLQQVLDFRKVESGNMRLKLSYGDIAVFIKDICTTHFESLMKKKQIRFSFESDRNQIEAYFDPDKIDKAVFNLLSNAYKYTPENGEVKLSLHLIDNKHLAISVLDTGIGIALEEQPHIFTRFYTNKEGRFKDSNGIGLSLTKDLIDLHQGTIRFESHPDKGTVFIIEIPIDMASYNGVEMTAVSELNGQDKRVEKRDKIAIEVGEGIERTMVNEHVSLLLVEDNDDLLGVIKGIFSRSYRVFSASNGREALEIVREKEIDIIVSDVMMPEMDGLELSRTLKNNRETSHIPILLLTAKNSAEDRIECYNAGADGYISKPFELKVLEARINNFVSSKRDKQREFKSNVEINISALNYPSQDEEFLNEAIKLIESQLNVSDLDVGAYAQQLNLSKSSLYRKIKTMTGLSPNEFIRNIRLKHACQMLKKLLPPISDLPQPSHSLPD